MNKPAPIQFFVPGLPRPGGSKTATVIRRKGGAIVMTSEGRPLVTMRDAGGDKTKNWRAVVAHEARIAHQGEPLDVPLKVEFEFLMPRPKGHHRANGQLKPSAPHYCTTKPDTTKLIRAAEDACTGILWRDDTLIAEQSARKVYGERPGMRIVVTPLAADPAPRPVHQAETPGLEDLVVEIRTPAGNRPAIIHANNGEGLFTERTAIA